MRVLYYDIDTLRPDHLSCYGYHRKTSPNIDKVCEQSIRFDECYCSDAPCLPSRSSAWTGRFGIHTGVVNHGGQQADPYIEGASRKFKHSPRRRPFAQVMKDSGMKTVSFSPFAERHSAWWFYHGFTEMHNPGLSGIERADQVVPDALNWLEANGKSDNWFLHINVWDPHTPFRTPEEYGEPFAGQPISNWLTKERIAHHRKTYGPHSAQEVSEWWPNEEAMRKYPRIVGEIRNLADYEKWINGYDTGIWYADMWFGKVLEKLESLGVMNETIIIITSDHGENHGELGVYGDHQTADRITCRVPYILRIPGLTDKGRADSGFHYQADLSATILNLLDLKVPPEWDGQSFADALKKGEKSGRDTLVISNNAWSCQRGVRWDNWLFIRTYHTGYKPFPKYMLFDVYSDPHETTNLAKVRPDIVAEGARRLEQWTEEMLRTSDGMQDPLWTVMSEGGPFHANDKTPALQKYFERLRQTGRARLADWLEANGGKPIPDDADWAASPGPGEPLLK